MLQLVPGVTVPSAKLASSTAVKYQRKDYAKLMQKPVDGMLALPNKDNILEWHYCLCVLPDIPFHGGFYWGKVIFEGNHGLHGHHDDQEERTIDASIVRWQAWTTDTVPAGSRKSGRIGLLQTSCKKQTETTDKRLCSVLEYTITLIV
ncbi:hypothetical protein CAEBREN_03073 [Caenorhabditis brenneri]|uniref:UBC core domain-containing protein n=1 Tax=Caenorhabditis brenneri TaxID=135651 RepID=G0NX26_CAEBE|nr:hypothetical protein CAEBREN_03073 [Caenorhabditis brenneri]